MPWAGASDRSERPDMIRKSFCLLLGLCLALTLCGCAFHRAAEGNAADESAAVPAEPEPTATAIPDSDGTQTLSEEEEMNMLRLLYFFLSDNKFAAYKGESSCSEKSVSSD